MGNSPLMVTLLVVYRNLQLYNFLTWRLFKIDFISLFLHFCWFNSFLLFPFANLVSFDTCLTPVYLILTKNKFSSCTILRRYDATFFERLNKNNTICSIFCRYGMVVYTLHQRSKNKFLGSISTSRPG